MESERDARPEFRCPDVVDPSSHVFRISLIIYAEKLFCVLRSTTTETQMHVQVWRDSDSQPSTGRALERDVLSR